MTGRDRISRKIAIAGGRRIVLYSWALCEEPRIRNLVCLDAADRIVWRAALPPSDDPDCFVRIEQDRGTILADTYRGARLCLAQGTGLPIAEPDAERIAC